jgi:hypothetical protein
VRELFGVSCVFDRINENSYTKYLRKLENHSNALEVNLLDNSETTHRLKIYTVLSKTPIEALKRYLSKQKVQYMSYATGHNSFTSQYLLNIYIYSRLCRLCIINVGKKLTLNYLNRFAKYVVKYAKCLVKVSADDAL